jgi:ankyrin repeat protein
MVKIILTDKILKIEHHKIKSNPFITNNIKTVQSKDEVYIDCNYDDFMILSYNHNHKKTEKIEKIFDLIVKDNAKIYFDDEKHFERFFDSPDNTLYHKVQLFQNNNILFYLAYEKYDLMISAIHYDLFDKINVNQIMNFYHNGLTYDFNILMFSCYFSRKYSSNEIIKMLLELPKIDVNMRDIFGSSALIYASKYSNTNSTEKTVKMLLEHPIIDVNIQDVFGSSALIYASRYSNTNSTKRTVEMLFEHPNINVNLQNNFGWSALMCASRYSNTSSTENTVKILLEHTKK